MVGNFSMFRAPKPEPNGIMPEKEPSLDKIKIKAGPERPVPQLPESDSSPKVESPWGRKSSTEITWTELSYKCDRYYHCPRENGTWTGERGDSDWKPDPEYVPKSQNPEGQTWKTILKEYGIDHIEYKEGEPNLEGISKGTVEIDDFTSDRAKNFAEADVKLAEQRHCTPEEVAKWRKENGYTWHECSDMRTMQKVPSKVHNNISHTGGVSRARMEGR